MYILICSDDSFYTGITNDLTRRVREHNIGIEKSCYTYNRRPLELKWFQNFVEPNEAIKREKQIKGWSRKKKIALINSNYQDLILFSKNYSENN